VRIIEVDGYDDALVRAWHDVYVSSQLDGHPYASPWQVGEIVPVLTRPQRKEETRAFAGVVGDEVVCAGRIELPLLDNVTTCTIGVDTALPHRRRGHGTAMLGHLLDVARSRDRSRVFVEIHYPLDAPPDGRGSVGPDFARSHGFTFGLGDICRVLDLPVSDQLLAGLADEAASYHERYRVETWSGPVPQEWLASYVALDARLVVDAPMGDLELEELTTDLDAHRDGEALSAEQGRTMHHAVALDDNGDVVAYTTIATSVHEDGRAFQWGTLVAPEHRGHRLGLAVKGANVRHLQRADPTVTSLVTWNAESNTHMIAVNEALGFRPVDRLAEFQLRL
jgi:GNAT superfamily N-acetyltransferase